MLRRIALNVALVALLGSALLALLWWGTLAIRRPPADARLIGFLVLMGAIQVVSWVVLLRLWLRAHSWESPGLALFVAALSLILLASHAINGFTPALGLPIAVVVIGGALPGFVVERRRGES